MKPASLNQKSSDARRQNESEKVDTTNNNATTRYSQKEGIGDLWNRQFIENNKFEKPYDVQYKELELKNEYGGQIHELELSYYTKIKDLEMKILELDKNYEHCQEEKNNLKSENTFQSVFSLILVTVGSILVSSTSIGWLIIVIGFVLLLKDKIRNCRIFN